MYQIDIMLEKELFEGKDMPFSDKAVKYLDYLAGKLKRWPYGHLFF